MARQNIRNVDLNLLTVFETVYATGNISHAARQLGLTQPAVSNAISRLREQFGDPLFVRAGRGVAPTIRSRQMIEPVREALGIIVRQIDGSGEIDLAKYKRIFRIVMVDPLEPILMPALLSAVNEKAPRIAIESRPASQSDLVKELFSGTLDLACYPFLVSAPGLAIETLCACDHIVVARRGHPKIGKTLDKETFLSLGHIALINELRPHVDIDRDIATRLGERRIVYMVNKPWSVPAIVGSTDLVSVLPRRFAELMVPRYDLVIHEPPVPVGDQHFHMMWNQTHNDDPGHRWLRDMLRKAARAAFPVVADKIPPAAQMPKRRAAAPPP